MTINAAADLRKKAASRLADYHVRTKSFTGPFDVLLNLIARQKVDISELDLSALTRDYLNFLRENMEEGITLAPEFIKVAALLVYIKTRILLEDAIQPEELEELPHSQDELIESLKILSEASTLSSLIKERLDSFSGNFICSAVLPATESKRNLELAIDLTELLDVYAEITARRPVAISAKFIGDEIFQIEVFASRILSILETANTTTLFTVVKETGYCKDNLISAFLAALKMQQQGILTLLQEKEFSDIILQK